MVKNVTVKQLAESLGEEYVTTAALIKLLVSQGVIKEVGKQPATGGRGKPSSIYQIDNEVTLVFWNDEDQVKEDKLEEIQVSV